MHIDYHRSNILNKSLHLSLSRPVRYAKWQKMHLRNICFPFGHTFPLIFYLDGWKLQMTMCVIFPYRNFKLIISETSSDTSCHFASVPKYSARLSTPVTTQNKNNFSSCLLRLKADNTSLHLFLWTGVMCRRMRCITKMMIAYCVHKTTLIPNLSWLWSTTLHDSGWQLHCVTRSASPHFDTFMSFTIICHSSTSFCNVITDEGAVSDFPDLMGRLESLNNKLKFGSERYNIYFT